MKNKMFECLFYISSFKKPSKEIINKIEEEICSNLVVHKVRLQTIKQPKNQLSLIESIGNQGDFDISKNGKKYTTYCF